jgi:hypothetical protein
VILSSNIVHTLADVWTGALFGSTRMVGDVSTAYKLRLFTRGGVSEEVCLFASLSLRCTRGNLAAMTPFAPFALDWDQGTPLVWLGPYRFLAHTCAPATINSVYRQGGPGGASTRGLSIAPRALPPGVHVQFVVTNRAIPPSSPIHGITAHHGVLGCQCRAGAQAQAKAAAQTPQTAMPTLVASTTSLSEPLPADDDVELPFEDHQQQHELELLPLSPLPPLPDDTDSQAFDPTPTLTTLTTLAAPAPATPAAPFINTEEDIKPNIRKSNPDGHQQLVSRLRKYRRKVYKQKLEIAFLKGQLAGPSGKRPRFSAPSSSSSMSE